MNRARVAIVALALALFSSLGLHAYSLVRAEPVAPRTGEPLVGSEFRSTGTRDPCIACTLGGLNLDEEERRRLTECASRTRTLEVALGREIDAKVRALQLELRRQPSEEARISALVAEIGRLRDERLRVRVRAILEVKETLTPEQLDRLAAAR